MAAFLALVLIAQSHDLSFEPKKGDVLVVSLAEDNEWDYPDDDMKGKIRSELTLRWIFEEGRGKAVVERVVYRGRGRKMGKEFNHDIEWTLKEGYLKGKDSEADRQWCAGEIKEGITLKHDRRGACEQGEC